MLVFIDDSGDPGFKIDRGSTRHFVIACCVFESSQTAELVANEIRQFKRNLGWHDNFELKFAQIKKDLALSFITRLSSFDFFVRAILIDKTLIESDFLVKNHDHFYNFAISKVITRSNNTIIDAKIRIDGKGGREYKRTTSTYLRNQANIRDTKVVREVKFVDSKNDQLIQLADMIAGCIRRSADESRPGSQAFKDVLSPMWRKTNSDLWNFR